MARKVYILSNNGHDFSDAERFGDLVFLNISHFAKWDVSLLKEELIIGMQEALEEDLIVVSSLASHCCVATALMIEWFGRVNFLIYRNDRYEESTLVTNPNMETPM